MTAQQPTDLLKLSEVALLLRCSAPTVRRKIASGEIRAYRLGPKGNESIRVARGDLDGFLRTHEVRT